MIIDLLLVVREHLIRKGFSELIIQAMTSLYEFESPHLLEEKTVDVAAAPLQNGNLKLSSHSDCFG